MIKKILLISLILIISMSLLICKSKDKPLKIALLLPGKIDDVSWNQAMYTGMKNMEKEYSKKVKVTYVEEVYEVADIEPAIRDFAAEGYDLIFGHGFQFMEPIINVAKIYPEVNFALGTGFKTLPNTAVYDVRLGDGGYLMGTLAGLMTETDKVGVVGGVDVSEIYRGHEAFKLAAKRVNPNIKIQELYTGDWRDAAKAKEGALSMYDAGVDIVWHSGDGIGLGVVDAAKEKDKYSMGNVVDQSVLAPNNVLSGVEYNWTPIIKNIVDDILDDNFTNRDNKYYWLTIENEGIQVTKFNKYTKKIVSKKVRNELKETRENIAKGTIKVPHFEK